MMTSQKYDEESNSQVLRVAGSVAAEEVRQAYGLVT